MKAEIHSFGEVKHMIPGHEIDSNLPLRKFFNSLVSRAMELSRSDQRMRRILDTFADEAGLNQSGMTFDNLANQIMFKSEVAKDMAYGVLDLQRFVEYIEYITVHGDEAKRKGLTQRLADELENAYKALNDLAQYADGIALETFDFGHDHTEPYGHEEPTAH